MKLYYNVGKSEISRFIITHIIGYDTLIINWAISSFGPRGYMYNYYSQELFSLNIAVDFIGALSSESYRSKRKSSKNQTIKTHENTHKLCGNDYCSDNRLVNEKSSMLKIRSIIRKFMFSNVLVDYVGADVFQVVKSVLKYEYNNKYITFYVIHKLGIIIAIICLFFTTSTIVSFVLRETQQRMLRFTILLQHHVSRRIPYAALVFTHLIETFVFIPILVGIVFLMFQFFKDQGLTFMVFV